MFRLYTMIEKLIPNGRKIEMFARKHNIRPGWLSVGNQLDSTSLIDKNLRGKFDSGLLLKNE